MYLVTAEEMRGLDSTAIHDYGIPGVVLMENAGRSTFLLVEHYLGGNVEGLSAVVFAGPGNNGGDGYVIARYLMNRGARVRTYLLAARDKIKGDALINLEILERMKGDIVPVTDAEDLKQHLVELHGADLAIDAMLGTGLSSEVRSPYREAIEILNNLRAVRIAVDIPSGLDSVSGRPMGVAVHADLTATYGFMKIGMVVYPGPEFCGHTEVVDISIPGSAIDANPPQAMLYDEPNMAVYISPRNDPQAHKGTFGHVLIVGGSPGKTGAPAMAARAAGRIGAGLVTTAVPSSLNPVMETLILEEMSEPVAETMPGFLGSVSLSRILDLARDKDALVLGPGLSTHGDMSELVTGILESYDGPIVIDADGLNVLVPDVSVLNGARGTVIITPHPGEMGRLCGKTSAEVQHDRVGIAREFARDHGVTVVLKGARTVTAFPDGKTVINSSGNPWMASGGQGDVLSGVLGGLLAHRIDPGDAIPLGVYLHGRAADRIVERIGPAPVQALDIIDELPHVLASESNDEERSKNNRFQP